MSKTKDQFIELHNSTYRIILINRETNQDIVRDFDLSNFDSSDLGNEIKDMRIVLENTNQGKMPF